jgi:REP element-mobilizing transposase RayT
MRYDPEKHHRHSIRLPDFDYSKPGAYFVTLVVQDRICRLGEIQNATMRLNAVGELIDTNWREIPNNYPGVQLDYYVVMPNHLHGILLFGGIRSPTVGGSTLCAPPRVDAPNPGDDAAKDEHNSALSVADIVGRFKSLTTTRYIKGVKAFGWPRFSGTFWQRNYHEHVIRDEQDWGRIAEYIMDNPAKWADDPENPDAKRK